MKRADATVPRETTNPGGNNPRRRKRMNAVTTKTDEPKVEGKEMTKSERNDLLSIAKKNERVAID